MASAVATRDGKIALAANTRDNKISVAWNDYLDSTELARTNYQETIDNGLSPTGYDTRTRTGITLKEAIAEAEADVENYTNLLGRAQGYLDGATNPDDVQLFQDMVTMYNGRLSTARTQLADFNTALQEARDHATPIRDGAIQDALDEYTQKETEAKAEYEQAKNTAIQEYQDTLGDIFPYDLSIETSNVVGKDAAGDTVYTANGENAITIKSMTAGLKYQISGLTFSVSDSKGQIKKSVNSVLDNFNESVRAFNKSNDNAINLQIDAKANQTIRISLTDMRSEALGLKSSDGVTLSVATQKHANAAVNVLDNAIQKALDQQTDIGAVANRMEQTSNNLHIARDNVQASESTIRDADMAKAMTSYTKNNILLQAAQSMLAQANQSSSNVLSLLQ
ncbi:MAG: flagellin [Selenomonas sp.]|nr:flagellin [Selenomonas sp.]